MAHYNSECPHQALDVKVPVTPADRFAPVPTLTIEHEDGETQAIGRTTSQPARSVKGQRPRAAQGVR